MKIFWVNGILDLADMCRLILEMHCSQEVQLLVIQRMWVMTIILNEFFKGPFHNLRFKIIMP